MELRPLAGKPVLIAIFSLPGLQPPGGRNKAGHQRGHQALSLACPTVICPCDRP